jgi:hypothetical protein
MNAIAYKPLEQEIKRNGFLHRILKREGDIAIVHKVGLAGGVHHKTHDAGFEVIVIGRHDGYELGGNKIEPAETFPSPEQWGTRGWTYTTLLDAETRFASLINKQSPFVIEHSPEEIPSVNDDSSNEPTSKRGRPKADRPMLSIPEGKFSVKDLAAHNKVEYIVASVFLKENPSLFKFVGTERRATKGKPTNIYEKA